MTRLLTSAVAIGLLVPVVVLARPPAAGAAAVLHVDVKDASCSNTGPGTTSDPYCTINAALRLAGPGDTVLVSAGKYREQVVFPRSGEPQAPITLQAETEGVTVLGSLDASDPSAWVPQGGTTWARSFARTVRQVLADGKRLDTALDRASLVPGTFWYDTTDKQLYVDLGSGNPGEGHVLEASVESYGLSITGRTDIAVRGIDTANQNYFGVQVALSSAVRLEAVGAYYTGSYGIRVYGSEDVQVLDSDVRRAGSHGLLLKDSNHVLVSLCRTSANVLHGIALQGTTDSNVLGNRAWGNAKPGTRVSNGIDLNVGSSRNVVEGNLLWSNQDSGLQVYNGSHDNLIRRNASYRNGDHGFDTFRSSGTRYVNNTAYDNRRDGISIEGDATSTTTVNNISAYNGAYELYVDRSSAQTWSGERDLFWDDDTTVTPLKVDGVKYGSTSSLAAATGREAAGLWANPRFVDPLLPDLNLAAKSPAVDRADASTPGFQPLDLEGRAPVDDGKEPNLGLGVPDFADLGAWEMVP